MNAHANEGRSVNVMVDANVYAYVNANVHGHVCANANVAVCVYVTGTAHAHVDVCLYFCMFENGNVSVYVDVSVRSLCKNMFPTRNIYFLKKETNSPL